MSTASRVLLAVTGSFLALVGAGGLVTMSTMPAGAADGGDNRTAMEQMMATMHGDEAMARMLEADGADAMLEECAEMMGAMSDMMNGGGMRDMMDRGGMMGSRSAG